MDIAARVGAYEMPITELLESQPMGRVHSHLTRLCLLTTGSTHVSETSTYIFYNTKVYLDS